MRSPAATPESVSLDSRAFEILVRQHHRRLIGYALAIVPDAAACEDLVQESFLVAYRKLDSFDAQRDFGAWVRGIVRLKCLEYCRQRSDVACDTDTLEALDAQHARWDAQEKTPGDVLRALRGCLKKLSETAGQAVQLFYLDDLSGKQAADRLDMSEAALRKCLQRARHALGTCIEHQLPD